MYVHIFSILIRYIMDKFNVVIVYSLQVYYGNNSISLSLKQHYDHQVTGKSNIKISIDLEQ